MSNAPKSFSCVLLGSQSLMIQCGERLLTQGHSIRAVVADDPGIVSWAKGHDLPLVGPKADLLAELSGESFDYLFSITNLSIIPDAVLELPEKAAINFHDGPLPRYAGLYTPAWALINGETEYGISFHEMTAEIDAGRILKQRLFEISPGETSLSINTKCFEAAMEAFSELVEELASDSVVPKTQDLSQKSYFGKYDRPAALATIDWRQSATEIERLVRALDFGPYENPLASPKLAHGEAGVLVRSARVVELDSSAQPGEIVAVAGDGLTVGTSDGAIELGRFASLAGADLTGEEALSHLGLSAGSRFSDPAAGVRDQLSELGGKLARSEAFWTRRLARLDPLDLPYVHSERARNGAAEWEEREIAVPQGYADRFSPKTASAADALVPAIAAYLGRIGGQSVFNVAFRDPSLREMVAQAKPWVAEWVPLRVDECVSASTGDVFDAFAAEFTRIRKRGSWLHDATARFPSLAQFDVGSLVKFGIEIGEGTPAGAMEAEAELRVVISEDGGSVRLCTDRRLVDAPDADAMASQLTHFLSALCSAEAGQVIGTISLLDEAERKRILSDWNETDVAYVNDVCVHQLFAAQVERTPDATALVFEDQKLTYRELDERANRLAHHLQGKGIGPDQLVGIFVDRSFDMMISVLGVQKAGGAYVPLDPVYPSDRIALMIEDSGASIVLAQSHLVTSMPAHQAEVVCVDVETPELRAEPSTCPDSAVSASNLAYVIYTSGSTGRPKGVMVEHRNAVNFFVGMDRVIEHDPPGVWLAVTSLSFDISVLEVLYTLTRGFEVVLFAESMKQAGVAASTTHSQSIDFGIFMWGADDTQGGGKYRLMLESAKYADQNGFSSFWTPERHFHAFGGPYPNPSVTGAAVAAVTERIGIRAGSCVLPLHNPIRVAEEWAAVDNLSEGRVGVSFAAGWQPNDFVIRPESFKEAKANMFRDIETVQALWRGEAVDFVNPMGQSVPTATQPRPIQPELPVWVTTAGNVETFRQAGACGANLLTHLLGQTTEEVQEKLRVYREARAEAGLDPATGTVTLMLHTLVGEDDDEVKEIAREPMKNYLRSSANLIKGFAWAFPAFSKPGGAEGAPPEIDLGSLTSSEMDEILDFAFERYYETSGLFGSVERCVEMVDRVKAIGVDEIGCLIDFGVPVEVTLESLELLNQVRERSNPTAAAESAGVVEGAAAVEMDWSIPAQVKRNAVTHMQCTPSMARMMVMDRDAHPALDQVKHLMIGGEAFPLSLAHDLDGLAGGRVTNMYGPTETTIWSSTAEVSGKPQRMNIGHPIANTQLYIVDANMEPVPVGVAGELLIGGDGVVRGYLDRPDLTADRFIPSPFDEKPGARVYRTGDQARFNADGSVDFLGRMDHQVKIRGYRVELGEIEARLSEYSSVQECVAIVREDTPGDQRLVAYAVAEGAEPEVASLKTHLGHTLPEFMVPSAFCFLDALPLTPNGKIDRKALPAPESLGKAPAAEYVEPANDLERTIEDVWKSVLHLEQVGARDNFFDLGGHSLLVVQAHRMLRDHVSQPLSLTDLYRFPTIQSLSEHLSDEGGGAQAVEAGQSRAEKRKAALGRRRGRGRK